MSGVGETTCPDRLVQVERLVKAYPGRKGSPSTVVLDGIDLTTARGEFVVLIGPSGCGKSTLLSCIAGLTDADSGTVRVDGSPVDGPSAVSSMVFQQASLLPWRTVLDNATYGLALGRAAGRDELRERGLAVLDVVGLTDVAGHYPHEISGGMQQRVNLARALVMEPALLLMDEPFGALDALTKENLQDELVALGHRIDGAVVFITHDIREAIYLADRVIVMSAKPGRVAREFAIPFARPRDREMTATREFEDLERELRALLHPTT